MDTFIGLDMAKKTFALHACDAAKRKLARVVKLTNDRQGYEQLEQLLAPWLAAGLELGVALEASGHLHRNLVHYLAAHLPALRLYVLNPLVVKRYGQPALHANHTDPGDARRLAHLLANEWRALRVWQPQAQTDALRRLHAERGRLSQDLARHKNRLHALLDCTFPELTRVFKDPSTPLARLLLADNPTAAHFARRRAQALARRRVDRKGSHALGMRRAAQLINLARDSVASATSAADAAIVQATLERIEQLEQQRHRIHGLIEQTLCEPPEDAAPADPAPGPAGDPAPGPRPPLLGEQRDLMRALPGMGPVSTTAVIARAGDVRQYRSAGALSAMLGACACRRQSGHSCDGGRLTPHAHRPTRAILYLSTQTAIRHFAPLRFYYEKARAEGKKHKQAVCCCMNRLVHWIWAVVHNDTPFDPQRIVQNCKKHFPRQWEAFMSKQNQTPEPTMQSP